MRRLKTPTFEQWVKHVFDHDLRNPQWYFDADGPVWAGSAELTLAHMTRLFNDPAKPLQEFDDERLNQGFWYLVGRAGSNRMLALTDTSAALGARVRCVESFSSLFAKFFGVRCTPHLSPIDQPGSSPLNSACYMFWDINPFVGAPDDPSHRELDAAALRAMDETLALDSLPCQESALHGLGHWRAVTIRSRSKRSSTVRCVGRPAGRRSSSRMPVMRRAATCCRTGRRACGRLGSNRWTRCAGRNKLLVAAGTARERRQQ
jgi:hypothetical protein